MVETPYPAHFARELTTVRAMIGIYCRDHHGKHPGLCESCEQLWNYVRERTERCPFGTEKPTCARCPVHCYQKEMRERIRQVMRYAGPRMIWRHPWLTLVHKWHGRKEAPDLRTVRKRAGRRDTQGE
ncbi:MAG TPA: nitrous oxide-stimulated promoter family protein [Polyangiaceae bacterium]|jgi:hypothetical protein|nr:MAG: hypothetical protein BWY17_05128 [Deltaproteobacteria bacterium ADurb.Bin207]HNT00323.1 nitrous oxide-stimulated promoter family protein [Polyangiaceae bacterium]HNZ24704.1 nitrous oxide-stimulated promoter family protein [Polyangiaceae bacterium]HOD24607.1 nitrous oxide-stimulated promoter family protein [Polyangiaceae bacterium]HOE50738.1 nitrous oxide-stimulated promoter family protein [Polyangiaceae bacterium]